MIQDEVFSALKMEYVQKVEDYLNISPQIARNYATILGKRLGFIKDYDRAWDATKAYTPLDLIHDVSKAYANDVVGHELDQINTKGKSDIDTDYMYYNQIRYIANTSLRDRYSIDSTTHNRVKDKGSLRNHIDEILSTYPANTIAYKYDDAERDQLANTLTASIKNNIDYIITEVGKHLRGIGKSKPTHHKTIHELNQEEIKLKEELANIPNTGHSFMSGKLNSFMATTMKKANIQARIAETEKLISTGPIEHHSLEGESNPTKIKGMIKGLFRIRMMTDPITMKYLAEKILTPGPSLGYIGWGIIYIIFILIIILITLHVLQSFGWRNNTA